MGSDAQAGALEATERPREGRMGAPTEVLIGGRVARGCRRAKALSRQCEAM